MQPLHQALRLRVSRPADQDLGRQDAAEALAGFGELGWPAAPPADRSFPAQTSTRRTDPRLAGSCHQSASRSSAVREGISTAAAQRE